MPAESFGAPAEVNRRQVLLGAAAGLSAVALSPLLAACTSSSSQSSGTTATSFSPKGGGKDVAALTWALFADPVSMDYAFAYDFNTNPVVTNMVDPLLRLSPEGQLQPALATSWKQVDPLTYVYTLRKGVLFHDGTPMKAADAAASMNRILAPSTGSYLASFVGNVHSVTATGDYELTVKLKTADALWQYVPATSVGSVCPAAFLEKHKDDVGKPGVGLIGTGPYKFVSWQQGQQAVLAKNDKYWNSARAPKIGKITFRVLASETTVIEGMANGEIDGAFNLSGKNLRALNSASQMHIARAPSYFVHFMGLNVTRKPFDDPRVRQALSYAVDKEGILASTWGGDGSLCKSPSTPAMWSFEKDTFQSAYDALPGYAQNVEKAKSLISQAGAQGASATILVATDHEQEEGVAVQAAAKEIGLNIKLQRIPYTQLLAKIADTAHDYDGIILEWSSDYPDPGGTLFQCFKSENLTDYTAYDNQQVNSALSRAATGTDAAARAKDLTAAQAQIVQDQSWIVFFTPFTNMPLSKKVGGYQLRPLWYWDNWAADLSGV